MDVTCNYKPAGFSTDRDFLSVFTSSTSDLMFLMLKEKPWFYYQSFFKDYYIHSMPFWDEKLQLLCCRSHRSEFQDIVLHIYLLSVEVFFCLWLMIKHFLLSFHSAELVGNFVFCSLEVSLRIISFRCPLNGLPVWNFGCLRVNCRRLCTPGVC